MKSNLIFAFSHFFVLPLVVVLAGCRSTADWRREADDVAASRLAHAQLAATGRAEAVEIETPADTLRRRLLLDQNLLASGDASFGVRDLPKNKYWDGGARLNTSTNSTAAGFDTTNTLKLALGHTLRIAAANSREYQTRKEALFSAALALDLEGTKFRAEFSQSLDSSLDSSPSGPDGDRRESHRNNTKLGVKKVFENGAQVSGGIVADLAGMLGGEGKSSVWGITTDLSVTIPLMRGSGRLVTREPLTQAERDLVYETRRFEQYKRDFMVRTAGAYLGVLISKRIMLNEEENYRRVIFSASRTRRFVDAGLMTPPEFEQSYQRELESRNNWVAARLSYESALDSFKMQLGLPPDARVELSDNDLDELQDYVAKFAKTELAEYQPVNTKETIILTAPDSIDDSELRARVEAAIKTAFANRPDFAIRIDAVEDAQRHLLVAEDGFRTELTIGGTATAGESVSPSSSENGKFKIDKAKTGAALHLSLPVQRTAERNSYRRALIAHEAAVRSYQEAEDNMKMSVREAVRELLLKREQLKIHFVAVSLAESRVKSNDMRMDAGRANMRDVLDAQADLLSTQNSLFSALRSYRVKEWELQKELGTLDITINGAWQESDLDALGLW